MLGWGAGLSSSRRGKAVSIVLAVGLFVGVGIAIFAWNRTDKEVERQSFCWGLLARDDVTSVGVNLSSYSMKESESPADYTVTQSCEIYTPSASTLSALSLEYGGSSRNWPYGVRANSSNMTQSLGRFPLGNGLNGWTGRNEAAVWLPDACRRAAKSNNNPVQLTVTLRDSPEDARGSEETRARMSKVLMKAATVLTRELGCATDTFVVPESAPKSPVERDAPSDQACGLTGFAPFRNVGSASGVREIVSGDDYRIWSCALKQPEGMLVSFNITTHPQLTDEYARRVSPNKLADAVWNGEGNIADRSPSVMMQCGENKALIRMSYPDGEQNPKARQLAAEKLAPQQGLFEQFVIAASKRLGCELSGQKP
ncbi:hypothetical protein ACSNOH_21315 [Streptomyces sp. URMC 127]|uniref:hypothetical protein n=1 Tax=Streptomyces sp. URMC 127 TaxID=3423402 RepID=UPI003F1C9F8C